MFACNINVTNVVNINFHYSETLYMVDARVCITEKYVTLEGFQTNQPAYISASSDGENMSPVIACTTSL